MNRFRAIALLALVVAAAGGVAVVVLWPSLDEGTDDIMVSGTIEVTDVDVAFKIPGKLRIRTVAEGDRVYAGEVVAELEAQDLRDEVAVREAALAAARAELDELEAGSRPQEIAAARAVLDQAGATLDELEAGSRPQEIAAARAALDRAEAELEHHRVDYQRFQALAERGSATLEKRDTVESLFRTAEARKREAEADLQLVLDGPRDEAIARARAARDEARARHALAVEGPRVETIRRARARVDEARAALDLARTRLEDAAVRSPLTGIVLTDNVEPGETVVTGAPVVTIAALDRVWLRAYINESDLGRVKHGQAVWVTTDSYPEKTYEGYVSFIASEAEFTPKTVRTLEQRVELVYRIKVDLDNPDHELKPGMPADGRILIDTRRPEADTGPESDRGPAPDASGPPRSEATDDGE